MPQQRILPQGLTIDFPDNYTDAAIDNWIKTNVSGRERDIRGSMLRQELAERSKAGPEYGAGLKLMQATSNLSRGFASMFLSAAESPFRLMSGVWDGVTGSGAKTLKPDADPYDPYAGVAQGVTRNDGGNVAGRIANWLRYQNETMNEALSYAQPAEDAGIIEKALMRDIPQGLGSTLAFITGGAGLKAVGMGSTAAIASLGAFSAFSDGYDRAYKAGNTENTALIMALLNAGVGTSEALPISRWLDGGLARTGMKMSEVLAEGAEEALQEFTQSFADDGIHSGLWNANLWGKEQIDAWSSLKDAAYAASIGAVTGVGVSGAQYASGRIEKAKADEELRLKLQPSRRLLPPWVEPGTITHETTGATQESPQQEGPQQEPYIISDSERERLMKSRQINHDPSFVPTLKAAISPFVFADALAVAEADAGSRSINKVDLESLVDVASIQLLPTSSEEASLLNQYEANRSSLSGLTLYSAAGAAAAMTHKKKMDELGRGEGKYPSSYDKNYRGKRLYDRKFYAEWLSASMQYADMLERSGEKTGADNIRTHVAQLFGLNYNSKIKRFPTVYDGKAIKAKSPREKGRVKAVEVAMAQYPSGSYVEIDTPPGVAAIRGEVASVSVNQNGEPMVNIKLPSGGMLGVEAMYANRIHTMRFGFERPDIDYLNAEASRNKGTAGITGEIEGASYATGPLYGRTPQRQLIPDAPAPVAPQDPATEAPVPPAPTSTNQTKAAARKLIDQLTDGSTVSDSYGNVYRVRKQQDGDTLTVSIEDKAGAKKATLKTLTVTPPKGRGRGKTSKTYDADGVSIIESSRISFRNTVQRQGPVASQTLEVIGPVPGVEVAQETGTDDKVAARIGQLEALRDELEELRINIPELGATDFKKLSKRLQKAEVITEKQAKEISDALTAKGMEKEDRLEEGASLMESYLEDVSSSIMAGATQAAAPAQPETVVQAAPVAPLGTVRVPAPALEDVVTMAEPVDGPLYQVAPQTPAPQTVAENTSAGTPEGAAAGPATEQEEPVNEMTDAVVSEAMAMMLAAPTGSVVYHGVERRNYLIQKTYDVATETSTVAIVPLNASAVTSEGVRVPTGKIPGHRLLATMEGNIWSFSDGALEFIARSKITTAVPNTFLTFAIATAPETEDASTLTTDEAGRQPTVNWDSEESSKSQAGLQSAVWSMDLNQWGGLPAASLPAGASIDPSYSWVNQGYSDKDLTMTDMDMLAESVGVVPALDMQSAQNNMRLFQEGSRLFDGSIPDAEILETSDEEYLDQHMELLGLDPVARPVVGPLTTPLPQKTKEEKLAELKREYRSRNKGAKDRTRLNLFISTLRRVISAGGKVKTSVFESLYAEAPGAATDLLNHYIRRQSLSASGVSNEAVRDYDDMVTEPGKYAPVEMGGTIPVRNLGYTAQDGVIMPVVEVMGNWSLPNGESFDSGMAVPITPETAAQVTIVEYDAIPPGTKDVYIDVMTHAEAQAAAADQVGSTMSSGNGLVVAVTEVGTTVHTTGWGKFTVRSEDNQLVPNEVSYISSLGKGNWEVTDRYATLDSSVAYRTFDISAADKDRLVQRDIDMPSELETTQPRGSNIQTEVYYPITAETIFPAGTNLQGKTLRYYIGYNSRGTEQLDPKDDAIATSYKANEAMTIEEVDENGRRDKKRLTDVWTQEPAVYVVMYSAEGAVGHYRFQNMTEARDYVAERMWKEGAHSRIVKIPKTIDYLPSMTRRYPSLRNMIPQWRKVVRRLFDERTKSMSFAELSKALGGIESTDVLLAVRAGNTEQVLNALQRTYAENYNKAYNEAKAALAKLYGRRTFPLRDITKVSDLMLNWGFISKQQHTAILKIAEDKNLTADQKKEKVKGMVKLDARIEEPGVMDEIMAELVKHESKEVRRRLPKIYRRNVRSSEADPDSAFEEVRMLTPRVTRTSSEEDKELVAARLAAHIAARRTGQYNKGMEAQQAGQQSLDKEFYAKDAEARMAGVPSNFKIGKTEGKRVVIRERPDKGAYVVVGTGEYYGLPNESVLRLAPIISKSGEETVDIDKSFNIPMTFVLPEDEAQSADEKRDINNVINRDSVGVEDVATESAGMSSQGGRQQVSKLSQEERAAQVTISSAPTFTLNDALNWTEDEFLVSVDIDGGGNPQILGAKIGRHLIKNKTNVAAAYRKVNARNIGQISDAMADMWKVAIGIATGDPMAATPRARVSQVAMSDPSYTVPLGDDIRAMTTMGPVTGDVRQATGRTVSAEVEGEVRNIPISDVSGVSVHGKYKNYGYDKYKQDLERVKGMMSGQGDVGLGGAEFEVINSRVAPDWTAEDIAEYDLVNFILLAESKSNGSIREAAWRMGRNIKSGIEFADLTRRRNELLARTQDARKNGQITKLPPIDMASDTEALKKWMTRNNPNAATREMIIVQMFYNEALRAATGRTLTVGLVDSFPLNHDVTYIPPMECASPCRVPGDDVTADTPNSKPPLVPAFTDVEDVVWEKWDSKDPRAVTSKALVNKLTYEASNIDLKNKYGVGVIDRLVEAVQGKKYLPTSNPAQWSQGRAIVDIYSQDPDSLNNLASALMGRSTGDKMHGIPDDVVGATAEALQIRIGEWLDGSIRAITNEERAMLLDMTERVQNAAQYHAHVVGTALQSLKRVSYRTHETVTVDRMIRRFFKKKDKMDKFSEYRDRLLAQARKIRMSPTGSVRHGEVEKLNDLMYEALGTDDLTIPEKFWSFWMNNALSGVGTWFDSFSGLAHAGVELFAQGLRSPSSAWRSLTSMYRTLPYAMGAALRIAQSSRKEYSDGAKWSLALSRDAEMYSKEEHSHQVGGNFGREITQGYRHRTLAAWRKDPKLFWRVMGRVEASSHIMMAIDTLSGLTNMQIRVTELAWKEANDARRQEDGSMRMPTAEEVQDLYDRIMSTTDEDVADIKRQVDHEVKVGEVKERDRDLRERELATARVPENILQEAIEYGMTGTGMRQPYGLAGAIYRGISAMKKQAGFSGHVMRANFPFLLFAANFTNVVMDWMPVTSLHRLWFHSPNWSLDSDDRKYFGSKALADVLYGKWATAYREQYLKMEGKTEGKEPKYMRKVSPTEYSQMRVRALMGHAGIMGAIMFFSQWDDEEDPEFMITGSMNQLTRQERANMREAGIMPYSIVVGGRSVSYKLLPIAAALAFAGTYQDQKRFGGDSENYMGMLSHAMMNGATLVKEFTMFSGLMDSMDVISGMSAKPETKFKTLAGVLGKFAAPGVMPWNNFQKDASKWLHTMFESPVARTPTTASGEFFRSWAWLNDAINEPAVNILGDPVNTGVAPWSRQVQPSPKDQETWRNIAILQQRGVNIPSIEHASKTDPADQRRRKAMTQPELQAYRTFVTREFGAWFRRRQNNLMRMTPENAKSQIDKRLNQIRRRARYHLDLR